MKKDDENKNTDVMTPERLRAYWFGNQRVPFWNYDPAQLTIGLEIEYFIAKVHGDSFTLATKDQYMAVVGHLIAEFDYSDKNLRDQPGRVSKDTSRGFIAIKPDFAWHILEIALPPRHDLEEIKKLLEKTFAEVDAALAKFGLERLDISCLPDVPERMDLVELDRLNAHVDMLRRYGDGTDYAVPVFPALIAATHIHANIFDEDSLRWLPKFYELENEALAVYSRDQEFRGKRGRAHRSRFYEAALGAEYLLRTVPPTIPTSVEDYCEMYNTSPKLFPNDSFFAARDMSYVRPTKYGTFEFRSACSFKSTDDIIKVVRFRQDKIFQILGLYQDRRRAQ